MFLSKLREALICLKAGRVTLGYPFAPHEPKPGFRGKITLDADLCFGCGGCANVCPAGVIVVSDTEQHMRTAGVLLAQVHVLRQVRRSLSGEGHPPQPAIRNCH